MTTTGFPTNASMLISETGALPGGVTFVNNNNGTATLSGLITDPSGASLPKAQVVIESTERKFSRRSSTDELGAYVFTALPPGAYQMVTTGGEQFDAKVAPFTLSEPYTVH